MTHCWARLLSLQGLEVSHMMDCMVPGAEGQAQAADQPHGAAYLTRRAVVWDKRTVLGI